MKDRIIDILNKSYNEIRNLYVRIAYILMFGWVLLLLCYIIFKNMSFETNRAVLNIIYNVIGGSNIFMAASVIWCLIIFVLMITIRKAFKRKICKLLLINPESTEEFIKEEVLDFIRFINVHKTVIVIVLAFLSGNSVTVLEMLSSDPLRLSNPLFYLNLAPLIFHMFYILITYPDLKGYKKLIQKN